jgi:predicted HD phosphohydrolase
LCAVEPGYAESLSAASQLSLAVQGGVADAEEVAAFEREPFFADAVTLRRFDDWGKRIGSLVAPLEHYRPLLLAVAARKR